MIKIDFNNTLKLHKLLTDFTGGSNEIRDYSLLDSALNTSFQTFEGKDYILRLKKKEQDLVLILFKIMLLLMEIKELGFLLC